MSVETFDLMNEAALAMSADVRKYMPNLALCIDHFAGHQGEIQREMERILQRNQNAKENYQRDCLRYAEEAEKCKKLGIKNVRSKPTDHTLCLSRMAETEDERSAKIQEEVQGVKEEAEPEEWLAGQGNIPSDSLPPDGENTTG